MCNLSPHQTRWWEGFLGFGNPSLPGVALFPNSFIFYLLSFTLPPFEENGLPFWVPGVLCQRSEVVLWNLPSVQMIFRWICGGESGLPVLFLCHLRTAPHLLRISPWRIGFQHEFGKNTDIYSKAMTFEQYRLTVKNYYFLTDYFMLNCNIWLWKSQKWYCSLKLCLYLHCRIGAYVDKEKLKLCFPNLYSIYSQVIQLSVINL